jgi:uncharacterized protein YuzE
MKIKYFNATDTALVGFTENLVKETREISENVYIDIDEKGNLVSMTIEHAKTTADLPDIPYQQIEKKVPHNQSLQQASLTLGDPLFSI